MRHQRQGRQEIVNRGASQVRIYRIFNAVVDTSVAITIEANGLLTGANMILLANGTPPLQLLHYLGAAGATVNFDASEQAIAMHGVAADLATTGGYTLQSSIYVPLRMQLYQGQKLYSTIVKRTAGTATLPIAVILAYVE